MQETNLSLQFSIKQLKTASEHKKALSRSCINRWIKAGLQKDVKNIECSIKIVGEEEGQELNQQYRQKNYATNVLTFEYSSAPNVMTDIVLCAPVVENEAKEQNKTLRQHYAHLIIHAILHAQGYDHETSEEDAEEMEALETNIMQNLGFPNPYTNI